MANMCGSRVTFKSENETDLKFLHELFLKAKNTENYYTEEICNDLKIDVKDNYDLGFIRDVSEDCLYHFQIERETKWSPRMCLFDAIIKKFEGMEYVYCAEECGGEIYINTGAKRFRTITIPKFFRAFSPYSVKNGGLSEI